MEKAKTPKFLSLILLIMFKKNRAQIIGSQNSHLCSEAHFVQHESCISLQGKEAVKHASRKIICTRFSQHFLHPEKSTP